MNDAIAQPLALQDPMVQGLCFNDVSVWGKGVHLLIGWGAPKVSADPESS